MQLETAAPPVNQKIVTISKEEADKLHQEAKQFQAEFEKQKQQFALSEDSIYYIVSSKFLSQWRDFAIAHTLERYLPAPMNIDIIENGKLKIQLKQGDEFQILSQRLFKKLQKFQGIPIRRKAVMIGNQKRIPIYLKDFSYVVITHEHLRAIDRTSFSAGQFKIQPVQAAEQSTIGDLLEQIRAKERYSLTKKMRIWKVGSTTIQQVHKHIKEQTRKINSYEYKIKFVGKKIQDEKTKLSDLQFEENQFVVVETVEELKKWYFLSGGEGKCEGCYNMTELRFQCGCKKVAYCSQQCKQKDKRFHLKSCEFALMEQENKIIQMTITDTSAKGRVGLSNLGNTCFMNSCLQCLSNTVPLTEYFISGFFQQQINKVNPIGTKGKLAKAYAKFIKSMWCDSNNVHSPYSIKGQVSKINPMFSGYGQHDSQEFFSFLVDGLHQDLNRIEKKPFVESVDSNGRPDNVVALQSWMAHIKRNQSIIVDLMTGQYRSKVTCPDCYRESITFDPFITVTLPIPQRVVNSVMFYLIYPNMHKKTERYYFTYQRFKAQDWMDSASKLLQIPPSKFGLYVVSVSQGLYKVGRDSLSQILHKIESQGKQMFLIQYSDEDLLIQNPIQLPARFAKKMSYDFNNLWFKFPFLFEKNSIKGIDIYTKILKFLYGKAYIYNVDSKDPKTYQQYKVQMLQKRPFKIFLKYNKKLQRTYHKLEFTFEDEQQIADDVDIAEFIQKQSFGDCQIDIRFYNRSSLDLFQFDCLKDFEEKMKKPKAQSFQQVNVSIDQCFQHFREVQKLQKGNQWYCSACKEHKQANKELGIYKAPKILILHLKRFKQKGTLRKEKNQSKVDFPMELNMKEYLHDPRPMSSYVQEAQKQGVYVQPKTTQPVIASQQPIYELYAVSNHYGGLGGGHYTAYAKNNGKWFQFNDSSVRSCHQSYITGSGAYILFYKRKE